uniref:Keratin, type I cuticular Ha6-like n=1 Tax=Crocodylus porosus TaxID=8502 RepID=A0A7M4E5E4_CROPO
MTSNCFTPDPCCGSFTGSCKAPSNSYTKSISDCSSGIKSCLPTSFSTSSKVSVSSRPGSSLKETMQFLNDRLACYLEKVRFLEQENADLEYKIQEWYEGQTPYVYTDLNCYYKMIEELQQQISCAKADNARLCLDVDNLKVASDDYAIKYEYEHGLCQSAEADVKSLRRILDDLTLCKADLETELEALTEELLCLRKNHEKEATPLRRQLGDHINVELDAAPSCDLNKVLDEIRYQYETLVDNNQHEVKDWYHTQMEELNKEVISSGEQLQGCQNEIIQLKHTVQALEIDLQTQHNLNTALENTLAETETHYSQQLSELQCLISDVEVQLAELQSDIEHQYGEYKVLLDAKCQLDCEISVYHRLGCDTTSNAPTPQPATTAGAPVLLPAPRPSPKQGAWSVRRCTSCSQGVCVHPPCTAYTLPLVSGNLHLKVLTTKLTTCNFVCVLRHSGVKTAGMTPAKF